MNELIARIRREISGIHIRNDVPYTEITTLGVGSLLPYLAEAVSEEGLAALLKFTYAEKIPVLILGGGSNIAGMDAPFPGIAIRLEKPEFTTFSAADGVIDAGGRLRLAEIARSAARAGFGGLSPLAGIPGTLGGAIRMNAGASGHFIGEFVSQVKGYRLDGSSWSCAASDIEWRYRTCSIPADVVITSADLKLPAADPQTELAAIETEIRTRREREPGGRSAGCSFRNISDLDPAGKLIDECGLKGFHLGNVQVSKEHANFVLNTNKATEAEYLAMLCAIRQAVAERHGFYLTPEVKFLNPESEKRLLASPAPPRINLLYGGDNSEREISLKSGAAVAQALRNGGFQVTETDLVKCEFQPEMAEADLVYPVLHGGFGEDGRLQKLLEEHQLRFTGSGSESCLLIMDKIVSKRLMDRLRIPTAKWAVATAAKRDFPANLELPVILKAPMEGSTFGIIKVEKLEEWEEALEKELKLAPEILVEEFVKGVEITVPIVNGQVLPAVEIRPPHGFYDYDAKYVYKDGKTEYFCPAQSLSPQALEHASKYALDLYFAAGCRDILRVDFIVDSDGIPWALEGNAIPGCTATSLVPKAARTAGISFERMCANLAYAALKRHVQPHRQPNTPTTGQPVPAFTPKRAGAAPNPRLVRLCRWMFRLALALCAVQMLAIGFTGLLSGQTITWPLVINGLFLLSAEFIFKWFNLLEKR